jgi:hypothetical protein
MAIDTATFEATLDSKIDAATTSNDAKEFLLLAKAVEATNNAISTTSLQVSNNLSDLANSTTALTNLGAAGLASPAFTGTPTAPTATAGTNTTQLATTAFVAGEVAGIVDSSPAALDTLNELAAALGDDANFSTTVTNSIATKLPLAGGTMTGDLTVSGGAGAITIAADSDIRATTGAWSGEQAGKIQYHDDDWFLQPADSVIFRSTGAVNVFTCNQSGDGYFAGGLEVNGTLDIEEVFEKVTTATSTTGTISFSVVDQGVAYFTANQTANRTINFSNVNSNLATGQSVTCTALMTQGSTAYYLNAYQVDGSAVTPKWSGGSAPTAGNASGIDVYTFTIIKTADATFTVLASQTQYA